MTEHTKENIENGVKNYLFPIIVSVMGFILTFTTYKIANTLASIESDITSVKLENRDTVKDIQFINMRLQSIENDVKEIKQKIGK